MTLCWTLQQVGDGRPLTCRLRSLQPTPHSPSRKPMQPSAPNHAMHRMSGTHVCPRLGWLWMPLIGDLDRWGRNIQGFLVSN
jgi:hypothetical protein